MFDKRIFKFHNFGKDAIVEKQTSWISQSHHSLFGSALKEDAELAQIEKLAKKSLFSLKDLILINNGKDSQMYFQMHLDVDEDGDYVENITDELTNVVEIRFQSVTFMHAPCVLIKITNINHIVQGEQAKARVVFQEALTATLSHE